MTTITRRRLAEPTPSAPPTPPTSKATPEPTTTERTPLRLNRNLMNFPLARDVRMDVQWHTSEKTGRWIAKLPKEDQILLILPADKRARRAPTGRDMAALFALLAEVQRTKEARVALKWSQLLRRSGLSLDKANRKAMRATLRYLSRLRLQINCWHEPGVPASSRRSFPPPVVEIIEKGRGVSVLLADVWVKLALDKRYYETVPLPLPLSAVAQNAALMILTSAIRPVEEAGDYEVYHLRGRSTFARKVGLGTVRRKARLDGALVRVQSWFATHGGDLIYTHNAAKGKIGFAGIKPRRSGGSRSLVRGGDVSLLTPFQGGDVATVTNKERELRNEPASPETASRSDLIPSGVEDGREERSDPMEDRWDAAVNKIRKERRKEEERRKKRAEERTSSQPSWRQRKRRERRQELREAESDARNWKAAQYHSETYERPDPYLHHDPYADQ